MSLKFKEDLDTIYTDDIYYDLFDGGYIDPENLLEEEDAKKVREAMILISQFLYEAMDQEYIEVG